MTNLLHWAFNWIVIPTVIYIFAWALPFRLGMLKQLRLLQRNRVQPCPVCELRGKYACWTFKITRFVTPAMKLPILGFFARGIIGGFAAIWFQKTMKEGAEYARRPQTKMPRM